MIRFGMEEPTRSKETRASMREPTHAFSYAVLRYYRRFMRTYITSGGVEKLDGIEIGCMDGIPMVRRPGARRRAITAILGAALDAYRARGVRCHVNRVLDTRMTADEYKAAVGKYRSIEGSCDALECGISAREPGMKIECPVCGAGTTMAHRGEYVWGEDAEAAMPEWRRRGLQGEPRPTLQWVRPHGKCPASNSHSLVLVPAGAPRDGGAAGAFVLARTYVLEEQIPNAYGVG